MPRSLCVPRRLWTQLARPSGFGPNQRMRVGCTVPGIVNHPLKYHFIFKKAPSMKYGLQGTNHLQAETGRVAGLLPTKMRLRKDHVYAWCACGFSARQPLCDGTHNSTSKLTMMHPVRFIPDKDMEVWFCMCKQTSTRPFCDGTHKCLADEAK